MADGAGYDRPSRIWRTEIYGFGIAKGCGIEKTISGFEY